MHNGQTIRHIIGMKTIDCGIFLCYPLTNDAVHDTINKKY